jgi:hypothetical protein
LPDAYPNFVPTAYWPPSCRCWIATLRSQAGLKNRVRMLVEWIADSKKFACAGGGAVVCASSPSA